MSMTVGSVYNAYADSSARAAEKKQTTENTQNRQTQQADAPQLSARAQKYLDKLNQSYDNMEFLVYNSGKDAKEVLSHSTKEVSVMLSREEIEKMASDEAYAAEKMKGVQGALRMSEQINREFGYTSAFGENSENAGTRISRIAVSFKDDGSANIFAELEKTSRKQREQIEEARAEKRAEDKQTKKKQAQKKQHEKRLEEKAADRYSRTNADPKRTVVEAGSVDELMKKIAAVNWNEIRAEGSTESGGRFDFSI